MKNNNVITEEQLQIKVIRAIELKAGSQKERDFYKMTPEEFNIKYPFYEFIAVDFDGTLCTHKFPEIGEPIPTVVNFIKEKHTEGSKIILYTCRDDLEERAYLQEAIEWCRKNNVPIDAVNENPWVPFGKRKLYADIYIDDRAVNTREVI